MGLVGVPFGATPSFGNNAIQFLNYPLGRGALTLGNSIIYAKGTNPETMDHLYGYPRPIEVGAHEEAHTYQTQVLGPLFIPTYFASGGISGQNPFERAANIYSDYGTSRSWWPQ